MEVKWAVSVDREIDRIYLGGKSDGKRGGWGWAGYLAT